MKYYIEDKEFGKIILTTNTRAKRFVMRVVGTEVHITIPLGVTTREIEECVNRNRDAIRNLLQKEDKTQKLINLDYKIDTDVMKLELIEGNRDCFFVNRKEGQCQIVCPPHTDFSQKQEWLRKVIVEELRIQAKVILWNRMFQLAKRHGFKYKDLKIQTSKTRWGSCSASNSINLSVYLMTLPSHLIDYVILHELCHTVHHDHSDAFWALMDKVTEGKAKSLRQELKENYRTEL